MKKNSIPKKIHYCWFGGKPLSSLAEACIESWRKYCPEYEIIEWNESNVDINISFFVRDAFNAKSWAFVSDYVRLYVVYHHGGIYLDTDVEVIKSFDDLLPCQAFIGFEGNEYINTGSGFGSIKGFHLLDGMMRMYEKLDFNSIKDSLAKVSSPILITQLLEKHGLMKNGEKQHIEGLTVFPEDYFCPKNPITRITNITKNTHSIHHYNASWVSAEEKALIKKLDDEASIIAHKQSKRVSIIIPVFNGENYLRQAIDSALSQTYKNIEVIVVNDGSTDGTEGIAKSYGNRIRYFTKKNGGVATALNLGIEKMRGYYFSWLSHDDAYYPEKIETQVEFACQFDDNTITVSNWTIIDEFGSFVKNNNLDHRLERMPACFLAFDRKTWLNGCAMLIPKSVFDKCGCFNEEYRSIQDYDLWFRLTKKNIKFVILAEHLLYSRAHAQQGCHSMPNALKDSDFMHSMIMQSLEYNEIFSYFDYDAENMLSAHDDFLYSGYKKTPAYILCAIIKLLYDKNQKEEVIKIIQKNIIDLENLNYFEQTRIIENLATPKNKKRILFILGPWYTGGVERFFVNVANQLKDTYDIYLASVDTDARSAVEIPKGIMHMKVSERVFRNSYDYSLFAMSILCDIDIAIGCFNLFESILNFYELLKNTTIKAIASNHEYFFYPYETSYYYGMIDKRLAAQKNLDASIWLTNFSTHVYNNYNTNGYLIENPNTYEVQSNGLERKEKIILCVGRFNDYIKRVDRILQCYQLALKKVPEAKLVLLGKCDREISFMPNRPETINDLIRNLDLPLEKIYFDDEVADMGKYYAEASMLLLTSQSEGFPMIVNEAACFGVPTVVNYIPGIEDIITDNVNGYIIKQNDINTMADKVITILNDEEVRLKLAQNAKILTKRFDAQLIAEKWALLFETIKNNTDANEVKKLLKMNFSPQITDYQLLSEALCDEISRIVAQYKDEVERKQVDELPRQAEYKKMLQDSIELQNIKKSRSWKAGKPLRLAGSLIRSLKHEGCLATMKKLLKKFIRSA